VGVGAAIGECYELRELVGTVGSLQEGSVPYLYMRRGQRGGRR
jgi:hypothetical protein